MDTIRSRRILRISDDSELSEESGFKRENRGSMDRLNGNADLVKQGSDKPLRCRAPHGFAARAGVAAGDNSHQLALLDHGGWMQLITSRFV